MKKLKIFNIILALILMISACDSTYDDIYDEIDKDVAVEDSVYLQYSDKTESPETYTMADADYEALKAILLEMGDAYEDAANSVGYKSFSDYAPAKDFLPYFLDETFFSYTPGTEMLVTYNSYIGSSYEDVADLDEYVLEDADYDMFAGPGGYNNFSSSDPPDQYIPLILAQRYPLEVAGTEMFVQYAYYGTHDDYVTEMEFDGSVWVRTDVETGLDMDNALTLVDDFYDSLGEDYGYPGYYDAFKDYQFDDHIPDSMLNWYPSAISGDKQVIVYNFRGTLDLFMGFTKSETGSWDKTHTVEYNWDTEDYNVKTLSVTEDAEALFKFTSDGWLFVPPLKFVETTAAATRTYELTDADYEMVGDGKYHNFTLPDEDLVAKISTILKANFNDLAVGDVFEITYKGYDGGVSEYTINLEVLLDE